MFELEHKGNWLCCQSCNFVGGRLHPVQEWIKVQRLLVSEILKQELLALKSEFSLMKNVVNYHLLKARRWTYKTSTAKTLCQ